MIYIHLYNWTPCLAVFPPYEQDGINNNIANINASFDLAEGRNNYQDLCSVLIYGRSKGGVYPDWVDNIFAKWRQELDAGLDILVNFRLREISRSIMCLNSALANAPELNGVEKKWIVTLERPDFAFEQCAKVYQEMDIGQVGKSILDAGLYSAVKKRLELIAGKGNYLLLFPKIMPWSLDAQGLDRVRNEIASFMGLDAPTSSFTPFRWRSAFIRRMIAATNNSWLRPSYSTIERELDRFEQAVTEPKGIFVPENALLKLSATCKDDWEKASGEVWLDAPFPPKIQEEDIFTNLHVYAPETTAFLSRNIRLLPDAFQASVRNILEKAGIEVPKCPDIAVLTLTYNHQDYITQCIESVQEQQGNFSLEHIIVDDMSTDGTRQEIEKLAAKYPHIRPIFLERRARGNNILALFRACGSKYAALCDGDDYFTDPCKLQKQLDFLQENKTCTLCFHPVRLVYEDGSPSRLYPPEEMLPGGIKKFYMLKELCTTNMIQTNSVMYRWRFQAGLPSWFDPTLIPGDWYWHLLHAEQGCIGYLPDVMSVYRRHAASLFAAAEKDHVQHREDFGLQELRLYATVDKHFRGSHHASLSRLATGVFSDLVMNYLKSGDDSLLREGLAICPEFGKEFIKKLHQTTGLRLRLSHCDADPQQ